MFKQILVPVAEGEMSMATVQRACTFAKEANAALTFYHARPSYFPPVTAGEGVIIDAGTHEIFRQAMATQAKQLLDGAAKIADAAGVKFQALTDESDSAYEGIINAAKANNCDLIFMASHGRRGVRALLLGSETQKVLTHCTIPVLVYRG